MKCPYCQSDRISRDLNTYSRVDGSLNMFVNTGAISYKRGGIAVKKAKACLDCGLVMHFLGKRELSGLRKELELPEGSLTKEGDPVGWLD